MARPRGFQHHSRPRRTTDWGVGPQARNVAISADTPALWTTGVTISTGKQTIIRIRGGVSLWMLSATSAGDGFIGALGICLVPTTAFIAGVASVPTPLTEPEWDGWMWYQVFDLRAVTSTFADGVNAAVVAQHYEIDSKAMRKWDQQMTLCGVVETVESGTASMEFNAETRVLVKLS